MNWVQYIFEGFKAAIPRRTTNTYGLKFLWQITPIFVLGTIYYANMEFMEENDPYLMRLYDLKAI
jgi:hypothetical protein